MNSYKTVEITEMSNGTTAQIIEEGTVYRIIVSRNKQKIEARRRISQGIETARQTARYYAERF
jgi:hypothetical protein